MTTVSRVARVCGRARRRASPAAPRVRAITHSSAENAHVKRRGAREHKRSVAVARRRTRATPNARVFEREKRPCKTTRRASASRRHSATRDDDGARDGRRRRARERRRDGRRGARRARAIGGAVRARRDDDDDDDDDDATTTTTTTTTRNDATRRLTRRNDATMAARAGAARARRWD